MKNLMINTQLGVMYFLLSYAKAFNTQLEYEANGFITQIKKAFGKLFEAGYKLFGGCCVDYVIEDVSSECVIVSGTNCEICYINSCDIDYMQDRPPGTTIITQNILTAPGTLFKTISGVVDSVKFTAQSVGDVGCKTREGLLEIKLKGHDELVNRALDKILNMSLVFIWTDKNGKTWTFGHKDSPVYLDSEAVEYSNENNGTTLIFKGKTYRPDFLYTGVIPK